MRKKGNNGNNAVKHITSDFGWSILASFVSVGVMQLLIYPRLARLLDANLYGELLTVMGYVSVIVSSFGSNLCYVRLIQQNKYERINCVGDFQILIIGSAIFSGIVTIIVSFFLDIDSSILLSLGIYSSIAVLQAYYLVSYRLIIDYKKNFFANVISAFGFLCAMASIAKHVAWPWIFSVGYICSLIYIFFSSDIPKEPIKKTIFFKDSLKKDIIMIFSGLVSNTTIYLDRFLIYPILGASDVSIYATAALLPKSINLLSGPITNVILSYLTTRKISLNRKSLLILTGFFSLLGLIAIIGCVWIGPFILQILYPEFIGEAKKYLLLSSLGIMIGIVASFLTVVVLRYAPIIWQTLLSGMRLVTYFIFGYILILKMSIRGICIGIIITNIIYFLLSLVIGLIYIEKRNI